jgi:nitrogen fixation/metabolism regulation signal transduction histidine kinase
VKRIRTRLVAACLATALLPAIPLSLLVRNLVERSAFAPMARETERALESALEESRERLALEKRSFTDAAADSGMTVERIDLDGDRLVAAVVLRDGRRTTLERPLPPGMRERAEHVTETLGMLRALEKERTAVVRGYVLPFVLAYVILLAAAAAFGALLARRIARPVEELARAARRVGAGDLGTRVTEPASGEVGALVDSFNAMIADLEANREERARLERLAAWRDLARKLAHEIKNPLTPIQLAVHQATDRAASRGGEDAKVARECREIVDEEIDRLRRFVREFSEFARLPKPDIVPGDLAALATDVARLYGEEKVALELGAPALPTCFDAAEIRRALVNLIDNGLAACREAGVPERVELRASIGGGLAQIDVHDRGAGIAPEHLARIFEPSFTTKKDGMGLGLAIVEGIVRGHGGTIRAKSTPGKGTVFRMSWPAEGEP